MFLKYVVELLFIIIRRRVFLPSKLGQLSGPEPHFFELTLPNLSDGELNAYSIRNKISFLKKITSWVNKVIPDLDDMSEETSF